MRARLGGLVSVLVVACSGETVPMYPSDAGDGQVEAGPATLEDVGLSGIVVLDAVYRGSTALDVAHRADPDHLCALASTGDVYCWDWATSPVKLVLDGPARALANGCAIIGDAEIACVQSTPWPTVETVHAAIRVDEVGEINPAPGGNETALFFSSGALYGLACNAGTCSPPCPWSVLAGATDVTEYLVLRAAQVFVAQPSYLHIGCPPNAVTLVPQPLPGPATSLNGGYIRLSDGRLFASTYGVSLYLPELGFEPGLVRPSDPPSQVVGLPPVTMVSPAYHKACAEEADGSMWCWGSVSGLPLAQEATPLPCGSDSKIAYPCVGPTRVPLLDGALDIAFLSDATVAGGCVLEPDHTVKCWHRSVK